jgi:hypothetical protein
MKYLIELVLDKQKTGLNAISIVEEPAILTNFVKLAAEKEHKFSVDIEKKIILGPVLIPDLKIFRTAQSLNLDDDGFVYFSADTIKSLSEIYMRELKLHSATLEHEQNTNDIKMLESWIIEDPQHDKSSIYGFDLPKGTWMTSFKVQNDVLWNQIKKGIYNGFSIEAESLSYLFRDKMNMINATKLTLEDELSDFMLDVISSCLK